MSETLLGHHSNRFNSALRKRSSDLWLPDNFRSSPKGLRQQPYSSCCFILVLTLSKAMLMMATCPSTEKGNKTAPSLLDLVSYQDGHWLSGQLLFSDSDSKWGENTNDKYKYKYKWQWQTPAWKPQEGWWWGLCWQERGSWGWAEPASRQGPTRSPSTRRGRGAETNKEV